MSNRCRSQGLYYLGLGIYAPKSTGGYLASCFIYVSFGCTTKQTPTNVILLSDCVVKPHGRVFPHRYISDIPAVIHKQPVEIFALSYNFILIILMNRLNFIWKEHLYISPIYALLMVYTIWYYKGSLSNVVCADNCTSTPCSKTLHYNNGY